MTHDATLRPAPGFATLAVHAGARPDPAMDVRPRGVGPDAGPFGPDSFGGVRIGAADPACAALEERIAALEGGTAAVAMASGQAARQTVLHLLMESGDEVIASTALDAGAVDQFTHAFARSGWRVRWADPADPAAIAGLVTDRTRAIVAAALADADIDAVAAVARGAGVPLVVDNTLATPYLFRPIAHGADIVLHADAAALCGHGHARGAFIVDGGGFDWLADERYPALSRPRPDFDGVVLGDTFGNFAFATACRALGLRDLGQPPTPADASLILAGIETLPLRMRRRCDNALEVATFLSRNPAVARVGYPGLPGDARNALARRDFPQGAGATLALDLAAGPDAAAALVSRLELFSRRPAPGGTRSEALLPAPDAASRSILLSTGVEDAADLIADLDQALAALGTA